MAVFATFQTATRPRPIHINADHITAIESGQALTAHIHTLSGETFHVDASHGEALTIMRRAVREARAAEQNEPKVRPIPGGAL